MSDGNVIKISNLKKHFLRRNHVIKALDGISFSVKEGETFGLLGEKGSGKTTLAYTIINYFRPTGGEILFKGDRVSEITRKEISKKMQLIFTNPYTSLDPRMTLGSTLRSVVRLHKIKGNLDEIVLRIVREVGLEENQIPRYPNEFSGGQRQRIAIARALVARPELLIADDPVIALDVSVQAAILNLFKRLKIELGLSCLFISNSLGVIRFISDNVGVLYSGKFVEIAPTVKLFREPMHPYTQHLFKISLVPDAKFKPRPLLEPQRTSNTLKGCTLQEICPYAQPVCREHEPELRSMGDKSFVACHIC